MRGLFNVVRWAIAIVAFVFVAWHAQYYIIQWMFPQPPAPPCPYLEESAPPANAGCMMIQDDLVLLIEHASTTKLDFPGGTSTDDEAPRCTAYRETFEETGIELNVEELLYTMDNGYQLFKCTAKTPLTEAILAEHSKEFNIERGNITLKSLSQFSADDMRFPNEYPMLQEQISTQ